MNNKRHIFLLLILLCGINYAFSFNDSLVNRLDFIRKNTGLNISLQNGRVKVDNSQLWLFFSSDRPDHKNCSARDSNFLVLRGDQLNLNKQDDSDDSTINSFNGIAWYKMYFRLEPGNENKFYEILVSLFGAAEIYYDGKLINTYGVINGKGESKKVNESRELLAINDTNVHCLAIRYALKDHQDLIENYSKLQVGPAVTFLSANEEVKGELYADVTFTVTNMLSAFFIALFCIHLLIFLFYREKTFNLYYALFLLFLSISFFELYGLRLIEDVPTYLFVNRIDDIFFPACCFFLVTLLNKLLNEKRSKHYIFFCVMFAALIIDTLFIHRFGNAISISMVFYTYFNTLAHSIKGIKRKVPSAKFLGWGILSFTIAIIVAVLLSVLMATVFEDSEIVEAVMLFLLVLDAIVAVLSIPLSMSAYLAFDFARTNKSLSDKLKENEALNERTRLQEKEKQEILENQNKNLETQVEQRTKEIADQNKVLEHQKKEITDSINYAKRIQQALLPEMDSIKAALPNSFVYYVPKDIVSGDFYFFNSFSATEAHPGRNEQSEEGGVFIAAADCTGHGVPGALMSMIVHEKLENATKFHGEPGEILHSINKQVKDALKQHQTDASRDGCDIALCKIQGTKLTYAGAYRPLYVFYKDGRFEEIKATKTAIAGLTPYEQVFEQHQFDTTQLKAIYMFSDGFADQFGGQKTKKLTTKKFKELLNTIVDKPIQDQNAELSAFFNNWKGNVEQIDDVLVIGITF